MTDAELIAALGDIQAYLLARNMAVMAEQIDAVVARVRRTRPDQPSLKPRPRGWMADAELIAKLKARSHEFGVQGLLVTASLLNFAIARIEEGP